MFRITSFFLAGLILTATCALSAQSAPQLTARALQSPIPPQPLASALQAWARESGVQVMYATELAKGLKSPGAPAGLAPQEALGRLLTGTGLEYRVLNDRTVSLRPIGAPASPAASNESTQPSEGALRLVAGESAKKESGDEVEEMLVEGEREKPAPFSTANLDLTRTEDDALPFTVFTARDIELSGAANLTEFLQNRVTQNFSAEIIDEASGSASVGDAHLNTRVDMRGWGTAEVVFLLNGRRMGPEYRGTFADAAVSTPNLQGIPLGSIERIEILASAGSAIYGTNATGGVINIITRQDFRGGQLAVNYETPTDTNAPRRSVDLSYGLPVRWGMGLRLGAGYSENDPVRAGTRAAVSIERWRRLALERDRARVINMISNDPFRTTTFRYGATPNIRTPATTTDLFPGMTGIQNYTTVPTGSLGNSALSAYQPGVFNLELAEGSAGSQLSARNSTLGTNNTNIALRLGLDKSFGADWRWSLDYGYTRNQSQGRPGGALQFNGSGVTGSRPQVPANAVANPFNLPVWISMVDPALDRPELRNQANNVTWNLNSTLRGALGDWRGFLDVNYSNNKNLYRDHFFYEPTGGWNAAFTSGRYNPFVDPRATAPAMPGFYADYVARRSSTGSATHNYQVSTKFSGPLLRLPSGALEFTAGMDAMRSDRYRSDSFGQYQDGLTGASRIPLGGTTDVSSPLDDEASRKFVFDNYAAYLEANLPLLSAAQGVPLVEKLEVFASGRVDQSRRDGYRQQSLEDRQNGVPPVPVTYEDTSKLYAFGLRYEVLQGVVLRATQSLGFRPLTLDLVTPDANPPVDPLIDLFDPVRGENFDLAADRYIVGGNSDLRPETTDSTNIGMILTPSWLEGLRISVDYLESVRNDAISFIGPQEAIDLESEIPERIARAAPDGDPSGAGRITFIDSRYINLNQIASRSVDFSLEQRLDNVLGGRLLMTASASRNLSFKVQASNTGRAEEQVRNINGIFSRQIEWNTNGQLRWEGRLWSFGWSARYFDYILARTSDYRLQGSDRAPWKVNHDINLGYRTPRLSNPRGAQWLLSGTSITFGVKNLFDREPRFWANTADRGIAPYDSIYGRSIWLQLRKSFD